MKAGTAETDMNVMDSLVRYGYLVIYGADFAEQVGLPFPSEPFLLAGGGLAGSGRLSLVLAGGYHGWRDRGYPMTDLVTTTSAAPATTLAMATQGGSHA